MMKVSSVILFCSVAIILFAMIPTANAGVIRDRIENGPLSAALNDKPGYVVTPYYTSCSQGLGDVLKSTLLAFGDVWGANGFHTIVYALYELIAYKIPSTFRVCGGSE